MQFERSYSSYEEFAREELRKLDRIDMSFEEILGDFDNEDRMNRGASKRQGLFDDYDEDSEGNDYDE